MGSLEKRDHSPQEEDVGEKRAEMGDTELEISTRAYCKMLMHAAKYPSSSINGVLLSKVGGGRNPVKYVDCIPMLHINTALAPMAEVALAQIEAEVSGCGLMISGLYHAHDNLRDNHVDTFSQKIADRIAENVATAGRGGDRDAGQQEALPQHRQPRPPRTAARHQLREV